MSSFGLVALLLMVVVGAVGAIGWRRQLFHALPYLAILNGLPLSAGTTSVRLDQLAACALCIPLVAGVAARKRSFRGDKATWCLAAILVMNVLATVINSPARSYSLTQCANLASAWVVYVVVVNFIDTRDELDGMIDHYLRATVLGAGIAILGLVGVALGVPIGGADLSTTAAENLSRPFGAYGTMIEPNILGSFCAASLVLAVGIATLSAPEVLASRQRTIARIAAALCAVALVLSFTRSAWFGALVGIVILAFLGRRLRAVRIRRFLVPVLAVLGAGALVLVIPGTASAFLRYKLSNIANLQSPTAIWRLVTYTLAIQQTASHPVIGWGTFTFAPLVAEGADFAQYSGWKSIWIPNFLLLALHDTGVIGLILWLMLMACLLVPGWRAATSERADQDAIDAVRAASLTAALVSLLVPFLLTTGFSLGFPWLLAGLLGARSRLARANAT